MARPKKPVTEQMKAFADELGNIHNSDEFHKLFDILCEYEADGGNADDECGRLIQKYIEKAFFKDVEDSSGKTEIQFIFESLGKAIYSHKYAFESRQVRDDLIQNAVEKIIRNGQYDLMAPEAMKFAFIKKVLNNLFIDHCRAKTSERKVTNKLEQIHASNNKKSVA